MKHPAAPNAGRRRALEALGCLAGAPLSALFPAHATAQPATGAPHALRAAPATVPLLGDAGPATRVWAYNGSVPGPMLRVRQGDTLRVRVANGLPEATTVHWHGLRLPNAMDGVPMVTQDPIAAGGTFDYAFACPDAGTFWYHPHQRSHVQVALGLSGVLVVEEPQAPDVDRDVVWVLDDWRLNRDGQLVGDFDSMFDASHAGRIGNTVTINGALPDRFAVAPGERIRLRLVNVANARIFALRFEGHAPYVIAHDGMPCEPYLPRQARVLLGPGMRVDLVLDAKAAPGATFRVIDDFFPNDAYEVVTLAYGAQAAPGTGARPAGERVKLPPNPVPPPDTDRAIRHALTLSGGMMGGRHGRRHGRRHDGRHARHGRRVGAQRALRDRVNERSRPAVHDGAGPHARDRDRQPHRMVASDPPARTLVPHRGAQRARARAPRPVRHDADPAAGVGGDRVRRRQSGGLDAPLPRARAPGNGDDGDVPRRLTRAASRTMHNGRPQAAVAPG